MKQINLLPLEVVAQRSRSRAVPALVLAVVVAAVAVLVPWWMLQGVEASLDEQIVKEQGFLGIATSEDARQSETFETRSLALVTTKVEALNQLAAREIAWTKALSGLGGMIPKDIVLSSYTVTPMGTEVIYSLVGEAPSNLSFATFVESLRQNEAVDKVIVEGFVFSPTRSTVTFTVQVTSEVKSIQYRGME